MGITGYVLLGLLAVTAVYVATIYNNLVRLKHTVTKRSDADCPFRADPMRSS